MPIVVHRTQEAGPRWVIEDTETDVWPCRSSLPGLQESSTSGFSLLFGLTTAVPKRTLVRFVVEDDEQLRLVEYMLFTNPERTHHAIEIAKARFFKRG